MKRRILATFLTIAMIFALLPAMLLPVSAGPTAVTVTEVEAISTDGTTDTIEITFSESIALEAADDVPLGPNDITISGTGAATVDSVDVSGSTAEVSIIVTTAGSVTVSVASTFGVKGCTEPNCVDCGKGDEDEQCNEEDPAFSVAANSNSVILLLAASATVPNDTSINATKTVEIVSSPPTVVVTLVGDKFANPIPEASATGWVTNLPSGMTATAAYTTDTTATITFGGTPTAGSVAPLAITIPAGALLGDTAVTVTENLSAKFNVRSAKIGDRTVSGTVGSAIAVQTIYLNLIGGGADTHVFTTNPTGWTDTQKNVTTWFGENIPGGLTATVTNNSTTKQLVIDITGTPTATSTATMAATIPGSFIGWEGSLPVDANTDAKWAIVAGGGTTPDPVDPVFDVYDGDTKINDTTINVPRGTNKTFVIKGLSQGDKHFTDIKWVLEGATSTATKLVATDTQEKLPQSADLSISLNETASVLTMKVTYVGSTETATKTTDVVRTIKINVTSPLGGGGGGATGPGGVVIGGGTAPTAPPPPPSAPAATDVTVTATVKDDVATATVGSSLLNKAIADDVNLVISSKIATIFIGGDALDTIAASKGVGALVVTAKAVDKKDLPPKTAEVVGDSPVFEFTAMKGVEKITEFGGPVKIVIPYEAGKDEVSGELVMFFIGADGVPVKVGGYYDATAKEFIFTTTHFSYYYIGSVKVGFKDLNAANVWWKDAAIFAGARDLVVGLKADDEAFAGDKALTRYEALSFLMNAYNIKLVKSLPTFTDVEEDSPYLAYVATAETMKLASGYEQADGTFIFDGEKEITREEMFTFMYRVLKGAGELPAAVDGATKLEDWDDAESIQDWAKEAIEAFLAAGVIRGTGTDAELLINPRLGSTRGTIAVLVWRLITGNA